MRKMYGYSDGEKLAKMWPNGTLWLREVSATEKAAKAVGNVAGALLGFYVVSAYDRFALSLTEDGWFIINDLRTEKDGGAGVIRFKKNDITSCIRLQQQENMAASGFLQFEKTYDVQLTLKNGNHYWIQIPKSAYESLVSI